jgi:acetolactate synthase small subunit
MTQTVSVLLERELAAVNRAVGVLRRFLRTFESLTITPAPEPGRARLIFIVDSEEATVETMLRKMRKLSGVFEAGRVPSTHSHGE